MYTEKQKTMRIYICDDEIPVLKKQAEKIKSVVPKDDVLEFSSGCALMQRLKEEPCDVLLIDIDMPGLSGLDIAGVLNREGHAEKVRPPLLVFVTGHDELVYESLHYHPFGFIRKSYFDKEVEKVLRDCDVWLKTKERRFYFRSEGKDRTLFLTEILYFEADGNYLRICTETETYRFRSTLAAVENCLSCSGFIRTHKGFLVNQSAIRLIDGDEVKLSDGTAIPIGKTYAQEARRKLLEYMRS